MNLNKKTFKWLYSHFSLVDVIACHFANDLCHWEIESTDEASGFIFQRVTSGFLQNNGMEGPEISHHESKNDSFVYVTATGTLDETGYNTILKSPLLNGKDHSEECFHFWFNFKVSKRLNKEEKGDRNIL